MRLADLLEPHSTDSATTLAETYTQISQAISLKRIADLLETLVLTRNGVTLGEAQATMNDLEE